MIYFDNAGTTKVDNECMAILERYCLENYFNPSALYRQSVEVKKDLKRARQEIVSALRGDGEIIFTSGGTESANMAVFGVTKRKGSRIIISKSEHAAVKNSALKLREIGFEVVECDVDIYGRVDEKKFISLVNENTSFVSIMHVNNETGGINDIKRLNAIAKSVNKDIIFHSDGVQAIGKIPVNLRDLGVDLYSMSAHKIHSPKGVGAIYLKEGVRINPIMHGGGQELGIRPSTENIPAIMCFSLMLKKMVKDLSKNLEKVSKIKDFIQKNIDESIIKILTDENCSPYIISLALKDVRGEVMLHSLEKYGIMIGTGSACSSSKKNTDHWQLPYLSQSYKNGKIRISFSHENTVEQADYFINKLNLEYSTLKRYT
ncbi:MAG: cysteine desulfurase family protein [Bacillota bacterium]|jgi:cysteine desulfurase|nr:cysteine desulfurase family protein [Bacillota bacterium]HHU42854.1 cysteine desulfurase [Clostridiales bacterium]